MKRGKPAKGRESLAKFRETFRAFSWASPLDMMDFHNLKNRQYRRVIRKAKLRYIPFHCLRDTFATLLLMSNTPISYISEQLGHKDPTLTVEHYARWLPGSNQAAMNVLPGATGKQAQSQLDAPETR